MKKHLLFAAMLALGAAPAVATTVTNNAYYAADAGTLATEEEYEATVKAITDLQKDMEGKLAELQEKYPLADTYVGAYQATLTGKGGLSEMLDEVNAKHEAGTLTSEEAANYQATVAEWTQSFSGEAFESVLEEAETEHAQGLFYEYANDARDQISEAEANLPENVYEYFSSAMDTYADQIQQLQWSGYIRTVADAEEGKVEFQALVDKAVAMVDYAPTASQLVDDIKAGLPKITEQMAKGITDFPDYEWDTVKETVTYWRTIQKTLTDYYDGESDIYTKADIEDLVEYFGYVVETDVYAMAQNETFQLEYNNKYFPVSQRISDITAILDEECPDVAEKYMGQLEDLSAEMTMASFKFSGEEPVSREELDAMLARVDEIAAEAEDILVKAKEEQKVITGINGVTTSQTDKNAKVYTIDGKRVNNAKKGVFIINGKKVVK